MRLRSMYVESRRNRPEIMVQGCIYQVSRRSDTNKLNIVVLEARLDGDFAIQNTGQHYRSVFSKCVRAVAPPTTAPV